MMDIIEIDGYAFQADKLAEAEEKAEPPVPTGAEALADLEGALRRFVWFPKPHHFTVAVLWTAYTHLLTQCPGLPIAPRLGIFSGAPGSGKTRALEVLSKLVANGQDVGSMSSAAMLRIIAAAEASEEPGTSPVVLFPDELDRTYSANSAGNQDDLTIILNAGYKRGAVVLRAHKDKQTEVVRYPCFAPVAFAGLATARLPDALLTRTFVIHTTRARREERPEPYFPLAHDEELVEVRESAARWARDTAHRFVNKEKLLAELLAPEIGDKVDGRDHEIWSCLWAVAVTAGDEWRERCMAALEAAQEESRDGSATGSASMRLLTALRTHYRGLERRGRVRVGISRDDACTAALNLDPLAFSRFDGREELRPEDVGRLLREHGLKSTRVRVGSERSYGWHWADLRDAWERVLPPLDDGDGEDPEAIEENPSADIFGQSR
ncbi:DUF3631 domain-containing protein [Streptomyces niger]|uniref:DUF3631 domain-containing protein n=1 Tax=Streptomyces niger TaxID=66373 RepID=UPI000699ED1E|nr:DUF3631 domain-containing protein [Streptomyces niger]